VADTTSISWTDSTFNPWIGCTKVGPGCDHCYAEALMDKRWGRVKWGTGNPRRRTSASNWAQPLRWQATHESFERQHGRRRRVFCASLADVFDNEAPAEWRADLFQLFSQTPDLDWLVLTKRIGNVNRMAPPQWLDRWPQHVWLGTTIVNRDEMLRDAEKLADVRAAVRYWSVEPMLGPFGHIPVELLPEWVIVGGESGRGSREIRRYWIDELRSQCEASRVPFFFKQWGGIRPDSHGCELDGFEIKQWPKVAA
jgi:protein gp37